jgi:hypothetical protein
MGIERAAVRQIAFTRKRCRRTPVKARGAFTAATDKHQSCRTDARHLIFLPSRASPEQGAKQREILVGNPKTLINKLNHLPCNPKQHIHALVH